MQPWWPCIEDAVGKQQPLLELGCDKGQDTRWLVARGVRVVATDVVFPVLAANHAAGFGGMFLQHDLRKPMPFSDGSFGVVVASLCLHYFDWRTTVAAVAEIRRCLRPGGLLLCRLNSTRDRLHGAGQGEEIEPGYFRQRAEYADCKRFFDADAVQRLFGAAQWEIIRCTEQTIFRYARPKVAWEIGLRSV